MALQVPADQLWQVHAGILHSTGPDADYKQWRDFLTSDSNRWSKFLLRPGGKLPKSPPAFLPEEGAV